MKTKIRIVEQKQFTNGYKHLFIEILENRYSDSDHLEIIGRIQFLSMQNDPNNYGWFAMKFIIETDRPEHIFKMAKIAKYIRDNSHSEATPDEVKLLIGAEEYFYHGSNFIPVSYVGMKFYKAMKESEYLTNIIAPNEIIARKKLEQKAKNWPKLLESDLQYSHTVAIGNY